MTKTRELNGTIISGRRSVESEGEDSQRERGRRRLSQGHGGKRE